VEKKTIAEDFVYICEENILPQKKKKKEPHLILMRKLSPEKVTKSLTFLD